MKIISKKKRKLRTEVKSFLFLISVVIVYTFVSLYTKAAKTNITIQIQENINKIEIIKLENIDLSLQVQALSNKDRVYTIASEQGLTLNQNNIIPVQTNEEN